MSWILRIAPRPTVDIDVISARLWELGTTGVAERGGVAGAPELLAGFATGDAAVAAAAAIATWAASTVIEPVDDDAWVDHDRRGRIELPTGVVDLAVGAAFGSGEHPTTRLALDLLLPVVVAGTTVLDFGTGNGVLAVAAALSGASEILAVDDDPRALAVADANLATHAGAASIGLADQLRGAPSTPSSGFDVTVANVLLDVHRRYGRELIEYTAPGGSVIVSGIVTSQREELLAAYPEWSVVEEHLGPAPVGAWEGVATEPGAGRRDERWLGLRLAATSSETNGETSCS